jgi:hypothetical protein
MYVVMGTKRNESAIKQEPKEGMKSGETASTACAKEDPKEGRGLAREGRTGNQTDNEGVKEQMAAATTR